jgi:hypothetical protein
LHSSSSVVPGSPWARAVNGEPGRIGMKREFFRSLDSGGVPTEPAATLCTKSFAADKCRHLENSLEPEEGALYGFFTPNPRGSPDESTFVTFFMSRTVPPVNLILIALT